HPQLEHKATYDGEERVESVACNLCGSKCTSLLFVAQDYISREYFNVVKCDVCGLVYTNPRPSSEEIDKFYAQHYYGRQNLRFKALVEVPIRLFRRQRSRKILRLMDSGRILDVGCGRGRMLDEFKRRGWETFGTELSEQAAGAAREEFGLNVRSIPLEDWGFEDKFFDAITLWHVLEHLPDPRGTLREVSRILKDDGLLVVSTPNFDSFQAKVSKEKWFHLDVPRHYYHFSTGTLTQMLESVGFRVWRQHLFSLEYDPFGLMQSLLNMLGGEPNFLYDLLKSDSGRILELDWAHLLGSLAINALLAPPLAIGSLMLSYVTSVLRSSGTIELFAVKNSELMLGGEILE
ncbi:MAG: class I SAM-dependent methyltransferase, partial [Dehalococcoidia bacterium]|nr:class I SAM-dependent methyltransferase [Dehalococcoidia bacterium]